jgi:hypothetical protein
MTTRYAKRSARRFVLILHGTLVAVLIFLLLAKTSYAACPIGNLANGLKLEEIGSFRLLAVGRHDMFVSSVTPQSLEHYADVSLTISRREQVRELWNALRETGVPSTYGQRFEVRLGLIIYDKSPTPVKLFSLYTTDGAFSVVNGDLCVTREPLFAYLMRNFGLLYW